MMRVCLSVLFAIFALQTVWAGRAASLKEAKSMSVETGKPILMDFMTEW